MYKVRYEAETKRVLVVWVRECNCFICAELPREEVVLVVKDECCLEQTLATANDYARQLTAYEQAD
jgi:hypothetical protein